MFEALSQAANNMLQNPNSLAYFLGSLGSAVMGPSQDTWQAQLGRTAASMGQAQLRKEFLSRLLGSKQQIPFMQQPGPISHALGMAPAAAESLQQRNAQVRQSQPAGSAQAPTGGLQRPFRSANRGEGSGHGSAIGGIGDIMALGLDPEFVMGALTLADKLSQSEAERQYQAALRDLRALQAAQLARELQMTPEEKLRQSVLQRALPQIMAYDYQRRHPAPKQLTPGQQLDEMLVEYLKGNPSAFQNWVRTKTTPTGSMLQPHQALKRISDIEKARASLEKTDMVTSLVAAANPALAERLGLGSKMDPATKAQVLAAFDREKKYLEQFLPPEMRGQGVAEPQAPGAGTGTEYDYEFVPGKGLVPVQRNP